jgi:hypothetical protein
VEKIIANGYLLQQGFLLSMSFEMISLAENQVFTFCGARQRFEESLRKNFHFFEGWQDG